MDLPSVSGDLQNKKFKKETFSQKRSEDCNEILGPFGNLIFEELLKLFYKIDCDAHFLCKLLSIMFMSFWRGFAIVQVFFWGFIVASVAPTVQAPVQV